MITTNKVNNNLKTAIFMFDSHGLVVIVNQELLVQYYYYYYNYKYTTDIVSTGTDHDQYSMVIAPLLSSNSLSIEDYQI